MIQNDSLYINWVKFKSRQDRFSNDLTLNVCHKCYLKDNKLLIWRSIIKFNGWLIMNYMKIVTGWPNNKKFNDAGDKSGIFM